MSTKIAIYYKKWMIFRESKTIEKNNLLKKNTFHSFSFSDEVCLSFLIYLIYVVFSKYKWDTGDNVYMNKKSKIMTIHYCL
jgi:hypothetical protein